MRVCVLVQELEHRFLLQHFIDYLHIPSVIMAAAAEHSGGRNSNTQLLEELEALSQSLYQSHTSTTNRRTASLALPRSSVPPITSAADPQVAKDANEDSNTSRQPIRSRRMSLSPWRSLPKLDNKDKDEQRVPGASRKEIVNKFEEKPTSEKKGLWSWKPLRALSHIGMQKLSCLFSIEVVSIQGLPVSMNGLRLSVCVRKKETREGAVHTMPSRVTEGAADFEETLFIKCHVYCSHGSGKQQQQLKFEPRPFLIYAFAVDAEELDFGRSLVDLSLLIQESKEKSYQGTRVRQWDTSFSLSGKAKGGELVLKLGFQIMEKDGGAGIYSQAEGLKSTKTTNLSSSFARKHSKSSFSVSSPKISSRTEAWTPTSSAQAGAAVHFQGMDELNLDEPAPVPSVSPSIQKSEEPESKMEDLELPDFEVVEKGVEFQDKEEAGAGESEENVYERSVSSEVVKEVVHDQVHLTRLTELDSIAQQIKALESMIGEETTNKPDQEESKSQRLDEEEETVTREFLQMLEDEEPNEFKLNQSNILPLKPEGKTEDGADMEVFLPDLGKGLGCVVRTRDGGYLAAMNPLNAAVARKDTPKLTMQISKPMVVLSPAYSISGFELFQSMAAMGLEEFSTKFSSITPMDELTGKTAEQIAFEGIASAIINGREKEGASSSAARTISAVRRMAAATSTGRKERISTGIWNVKEEPCTLDEILGFSMQKIEAFAIDALKVQANMAEEDAPFDVSAVTGKPVTSNSENDPFASTIPLEEWMESDNFTSYVTILVVVQLRDPLRRYEAVGGPVIAVIQANQTEDKPNNNNEERFKLASLHIGGLKVNTGGKRNLWDNERQRLTAMQWLVEFGLVKAGKKGKTVVSKDQNLLWSTSSRVMADMWLKPMRNPDVKFAR